MGTVSVRVSTLYQAESTFFHCSEIDPVSWSCSEKQVHAFISCSSLQKAAAHSEPCWCQSLEPRQLIISLCLSCSNTGYQFSLLSIVKLCRQFRNHLMHGTQKQHIPWRALLKSDGTESEPNRVKLFQLLTDGSSFLMNSDVLQLFLYHYFYWIIFCMSYF